MGGKVKGKRVGGRGLSAVDKFVLTIIQKKVSTQVTVNYNRILSKTHTQYRTLLEYELYGDCQLLIYIPNFL